MLGDATIRPMIAVKDQERANAFYKDTLGLTQDESNPGGQTFKVGDSAVEVYTSEFAGTAKNTVVSFFVSDLDRTMKGLRDKGVKFIDYDQPEFKTENGVADFGDGNRLAWFNDPDGNILGLIETK